MIKRILISATSLILIPTICLAVETGILYFECPNGHKVYPPKDVSSKGVKPISISVPYPPTSGELADYEIFTPDVFPGTTPPGLKDKLVTYAGEIGITDPISAWTPAQVKDVLAYTEKNYSSTYTAVLNTLKKHYDGWRDSYIENMVKPKVAKVWNDIAKNALNATSSETVHGISIKADRYEAVVEYTKDGRVIKCPVCGAVLAKWKD